MKSITFALLAGTLIFATDAALAQSLNGTARTFFTTAPGVSNFSGNKTGANTPIRNHADIYATVYADGTVNRGAVVRVKRR